MIDENVGYVLKAAWPAPDNIVALSTCRFNGFSQPPFDEFNLAQHVGDSEEAVNANRRQLIKSCEGLESIQWLSQIHGKTIVDLPIGDSTASNADVSNTSTANTRYFYKEVSEQNVPEADAAYTTVQSIACAVLTADCLPLVFCDESGSEIAAVHAGWRGLASGILESTVDRFCADESQLLVWIGPAISQANFEVGSEVREAFMDTATKTSSDLIDKSFKKNPLRPNHFFADLTEIARIRLAQAGVEKVYCANLCNYALSEQFFSYRRDPITGRIATLIYIK